MKALWRRMRRTWPEGVAWDDLPGFMQETYRRDRRTEQRVWDRAIARAVLREAGL